MKLYKLRQITVWPEPIWIKVKTWWQILLQHQSTYLRGPEFTSIEIPPFRTHFIKFLKTAVNCFLCIKSYFTMFTLRGIFTKYVNLVWKVRFQLMQFLGLLGVYFITVVVFITKSALLFRLALAIMWDRATISKTDTYFTNPVVEKE